MIECFWWQGNLFLGIYYNLSIWYKLSDQTKYGAYLSIFGALITITLNLILIPKYDFVGCAWATLICYLSMTIASYLLGKKHYMIRYNIRRIFIYLGFVSILYFISIYYNSIMINLLYIMQLLNHMMIKKIMKNLAIFLLKLTIFKKNYIKIIQ